MPDYRVTPVSAIGHLRALASELVARATLASRAGLTFGGKRDLYAALGYDRDLTPQMYRARFKRNGVARRIVRAFPAATWRGGCELIENEEPDTQTPFEAAFIELSTRLKLFPALQQADILAGLGEFGVLMIGAPGEWSTPLATKVAPESVVYLQAYGQDELTIDATVTDRKDPRYGQPAMYKLARVADGDRGDARVHWTRMIHIPSDDVLDDRTKGTPRLEAPWNDLDDLEKVKGGGAEAFWLKVNEGLQVKLDPNVEFTKDDEKALAEEVENYKHKLSRVMQTKGVDVETLVSNVAMFDKNVDAILKLLSVSSEIPYRILTGSERGQLASEQDDDNWTERVNDRRSGHAEPYALRPLVDRFIAHGILPQPKKEGAPGGYLVRWPDQQDISTAERLDQAEKAASINQKQGETVIASDEIRDRFLGLPPLEEVASDDELGFEADDDEDEENEGDADGARAARRAAAARRPRSTTPVQRLADARQARFARLVASGFADMRASIRLSDLETAIADGPEATTRLLDGAVDLFGDALQASLEEELRDVLVTAGTRAAHAATRAAAGLRAADGELLGGFDGTNPEATRWASEHAAQLVTQVTDETRAAIRVIVARAFDEQLTPRAAARLIRPLVGLTERQTMALVNARLALLEAKPGTRVKVGRTFVRVPRAGASPAFVQRVAANYAARLQRQRAATIARHELMEAGHEGQHQLWRQATARGDLAPTTLRTPLITDDERLCPICRQMEGQRVAIDQPFTLPNGSRKMNPPFHVTCRCDQVLVADTPRRAHAA